MKNNYKILFLSMTLIPLLGFAQCPPSGLFLFNGNANDASMSANHGTVVGATLTTDRNNIANSAYYFDGVDDHIVVADDTSNDLSATWTIMAWIRPDSTYGSFRDNHVSIVDKWGNAGPTLATYLMGIHTNGELEGFTHTGSAGTYKWSSNIIPINTWTHVAVTRSADDTVRLYINSVKVHSYLTVKPQNSKFDLHFGTASDPSIQSAYPTKYRFKGKIDDVKIYKCALTPSQFPSDITNMNQKEMSINIYPNPSNGKLNIDQTISDHYVVNVYDLNGKLIQHAENTNTIELNGVAGLYFVQFIDLNTGIIYTEEIVKQ